MPSQKEISLMEEKAKRYSQFSQFTRALPCPGTKDEVKNEINYLNKRIKILSKEMTSVREALKDIEEQFLFYANYKHSLERTITPLTLVTSPTKKRRKDKWTLLQEKVNSLTEEEKDKIEAVQLWEKGRKRKENN